MLYDLGSHLIDRALALFGPPEAVRAGLVALHGTLGSYVKHGLDPQEDALREGSIPNSEG